MTGARLMMTLTCCIACDVAQSTMNALRPIEEAH